MSAQKYNLNEKQALGTVQTILELRKKREFVTRFYKKNPTILLNCEPPDQMWQLQQEA